MLNARMAISGAAALLAATLAGWTSANAQGLDAPLVQCQAVTLPAAVAGCAASQDPLKHGGVTINDQGDVTVLVYGAASNSAYAVAFVAGDGASSTAIGNLTTDNHGNGALRKDAFFKFGTVGAGNVTLDGGGGIEFLTGVLISNNGLESARDFQPALVRCADVGVPAALSNCGNDSLTSGRIDVENDDGALAIHLSGARPGTNYTAIFRAPDGTSMTLGTFKTNLAGNGTLVATSAFAPGTVGAGSIVVQSGGIDEFVSGFRVNQRFVRPDVAISNLVQCGEVTDPTSLACGSDPLDRGSYQVNSAGAVIVDLRGAQPSTNYELWFRPLDNSGDTDTGIAVPTDKHGNAHVGPKPCFSADSVDAGTLVVKHQADSADQFVAGFKVH